MSKLHVVLVGYSGLIGRQLVPQLVAAGFRGHVVSRTKRDLPEPFSWIDTHDLQDGSYKVPTGSIVISLCKLPLTAQFLERFEGARQLIALSSTSMFTKQESPDPSELQLVQGLSEAEAKIEAASGQLAYTILRPTIIYDAETDVSINKIADVIRRYRFFAIAGKGNGLRQPIHASDVASMIVNSIEREAAINRAFNISGGESLSYRTMVERISNGIGAKPRIVSVPTWVLKGLVSVMRVLKLTKHSPSMIDRMNDDLAFDTREAVELLGFEPRKFHPAFERKIE